MLLFVSAAADPLLLQLEVLANDVADVSIGFDSDQNEVPVIGRDGNVQRI